METCFPKQKWLACVGTKPTQKTWIFFFLLPNICHLNTKQRIKFYPVLADQTHIFLSMAAGFRQTSKQNNLPNAWKDSRLLLWVCVFFVVFFSASPRDGI